MRLITIFVALGLCAEAHAVIYECTDQAGQKIFTDRGCPHKPRIYPLQPEAPLVFAPLDEAERERLRKMSAAADKARQQAQSMRARNRQQQARQSSERSVACADARAALDDLERLRRKGYPLAKQQQLDQTRRNLKAKKKANC